MRPSKNIAGIISILIAGGLISKNLLADVNPRGSSLTITLGGTSPYINEGTISGSIYGISTNTDNGATVTNSGTIAVTGDNNHAIVTNGANPSITNSGLITTLGGYSAGIANWGEANGSFTNTLSGVINVSGTNAWGLSLSNSNFSVSNYGTITSSGSNSMGISFTAGGNLFNDGVIDSSGGSYSAIWTSGGVTNITNNGSITANSFGIRNTASIATLNNAQGGDNSTPSTTALTYTGALPSNYSIIINSSTHYGQLSGSSVTGSTAFAINANSLITSRLYTGVLQGLTDSRVGLTRTGAYDNMNWTLALQSGSSTTWDLSFTGISLTQTQSSLASQALKLRGIYNSASLVSHYPNSNTYDCNLFDVKGMCISAGGRYSTVDNPSSNSTAAVVTLGYKVSPNIRIGGFLDQSVNNNNPTGVHLSNSNPMMGAFIYWNQNADSLGYQVKIANAYQDKDLSTTRDVIGTSEAGTGKTSLTTQSYVGELSYAFMYKENTLVRPYFALRHTIIEQDAYTETGVTTPLTYSALNDRTNSMLMGVKFKHALTPKTNLTGSLGVEQDLHHKTDRLTATGIAGLTSENLSSDLHRTRPVASIGATYEVAKSQRLSGEVLVQQLPFQSTAGATAYFNYMIGF